MGVGVRGSSDDGGEGDEGDEGGEEVRERGREVWQIGGGKQRDEGDG